MPNKKSIEILNNYKDLAKASKFGVNKRVNNIIDLYSARKIYNIKTAKTLLDQLTDKKKKNVDIGIKKYNEVFDRYQKAEPLNVRHKRLRQEKVERSERKNRYGQVLGEMLKKTDRNDKDNQLQRVSKDKNKLKGLFKIQKLFKNTVIFDIIETESAMDKNVISFTLKPNKISLNLQLEDVKTILFKAYAKVLKLLPKKSHFHFYTNLYLGTAPLTSRAYSYKKPAEWANHVASQIEKTIQSEETYKLRDMEIKFNSSFFRQAENRTAHNAETARAY